jgi:hypothetical protein
MAAAVDEHMSAVHRLASGALSVQGKTTVSKVKQGTSDLQDSILQGTARKRLRQAVPKSAAPAGPRGTPKKQKMD